MNEIKQSLVWWCFGRNIEPATLVKEAKAIGYASIEMCPEKHWPLTQDNGLAVAIIGGHESLVDGCNKRENKSRIVDELHANIAKAKANNIPSLIAFSGNREGKSELEGAENTAECLAEAAPAAEAAGITICIELLNSKVNHPDYQCDTTPWGVHVCKMVNSPAVKLLYDIYHMQIMEGDLIRTIKDNIDYIGHFHTAGNPGRNDMDEENEIYYPPIMRAIAGTDYAGYVGHEFIPKGDMVKAAKAAYELCKV
ncbi:MAG: TIM barrel protein [Planctomycetota bacterium]|nr:TIM barrel protein [Planctomycetota bacterium]MDA1139987.1 TIM barrel protein [Planctomycetota bacterium]